MYTVKPPNRGHVGTRIFFFIKRCPLFKCTGIIGIGTSSFVLYRGVLYQSFHCIHIYIYIYTYIIYCCHEGVRLVVEVVLIFLSLSLSGVDGMKLKVQLHPVAMYLLYRHTCIHNSVFFDFSPFSTPSLYLSLSSLLFPDNPHLVPLLFSLSGVPDTLRAQQLSMEQVGKLCSAYQQLLNGETNTSVTAPSDTGTISHA